MSDKSEEKKVNPEEVRLARLRANAEKARAKRAENAALRRKAKEEMEKGLEYYSDGESEVEVEDESGSETDSAEEQLPPPPPPKLERQTGANVRRPRVKEEDNDSESEGKLPELPPKRKPGRPKGSKAKKVEQPSEASLRQQVADLYDELKQTKKKQSKFFDELFQVRVENEKLKKHIKEGKGKKGGSVKIVHNTITPPPTAVPKPKTDEDKKELSNLLKF